LVSFHAAREPPSPGLENGRAERLNKTTFTTGGRDMPTYDFKCEKCNKSFSETMSISEYDKTKFRCPKCKSTKVKQQITSFQTVTSKKS